MGGGINNTKIVTETGKYSLDAVQNNPSVKGSLRNGLENVSGKVDRQIVNAWNDFDYNIGGYIKLIKVKVLKDNASYPLKFTVNGRGFNKPIDLTVNFKSASNNDPDIDKCIYDAGFVSSYDYKFYIVKEATSTWGIYVSHLAWTSVAVTNAEIFAFARQTIFEVTYPNTLVDSLPAGALEFKISSQELLLPYGGQMSVDADFNDYISQGWYTNNGTNGGQVHAPHGSDNGILAVFSHTVGGTINTRHIWIGLFAMMFMTRYCKDGTWSEWKSFKLE